MPKFFDEYAAIQIWEGNSKIREEFSGQKDVYLAYAKAKAEDLVKESERKLSK